MFSNEIMLPYIMWVVLILIIFGKYKPDPIVLNSPFIDSKIFGGWAG